MTYRKTGAYKLFSPHLEYLCTLLAENMGSSLHLLYAFTDILRLPVQAFLRSQGIARLFLAVAVDRGQGNLINLVSQMTEISVAELLILNADHIFAPLYFRPSTKFSECRDFFLKVLLSSGVDYTFQQILTSNLPALLLEIFIRAAREPTCTESVSTTSISCDSVLNSLQGAFDTILRRIFSEIDQNSSVSVQLGRPLLTIFGRAGDLLRGMYGRKSTSERSEILQGLSLLVRKVGASISGVTPQVNGIPGCSTIYEQLTERNMTDHVYTPIMLQRPTSAPSESSSVADTHKSPCIGGYQTYLSADDCSLCASMAKPF